MPPGLLANEGMANLGTLRPATVGRWNFKNKSPAGITRRALSCPGVSAGENACLFTGVFEPVLFGLLAEVPKVEAADHQRHHDDRQTCQANIRPKKKFPSHDYPLKKTER